MRIQVRKIFVLGGILLCFILAAFLGCTDINQIRAGGSGDFNSKNLSALPNDPDEPFYVDQSQFFDTKTVWISNLGSMDAEYLQDYMSCFPTAKLEITDDGKDKVKVFFHLTQSDTIYTFSVKDPDSNITYTKSLDEQILSINIEEPSPYRLSSEDQVHLKANDEISAETFLENVLVDGETFDGIVKVDNDQITLIPNEDWSVGSHTIKISNKIESSNGKRIHNDIFIFFGVVDPYQSYAEVSSRVNSEDKPVELSFTLGDYRSIIDGEEPLTQEFMINGAYSGENVTTTVSLYRFNSIEEYQQEGVPLLKTDREISQSLVDEKEISIEKGEITSTDGYGTASTSSVYKGSVDFGVLEQGAYIMEIKAPSMPDKFTLGAKRRIVQVTDISLYLQTANTETTAWANSVGSLRSFDGASIEFGRYVNKGSETTYETQITGTLDKEGIGFLKYPITKESNSNETSNNQVSIRDQAGELIYVDNTNVLSNYYQEEHNLYYSYLYLDRSMYRPTDTIQFWGFIQPYGRNEVEMPEEVEVIFDPSRLKIAVTVTPDENGVFQGEIPIESIKSANYYVSLVVKDGTSSSNYYRDEEEEKQNICDSVWIEIKNYTKPLFKISAETDYNLYSDEDMVNLTITPTFYDGTPLPNYEVEFTLIGEDVSEKVITDDEGVATLSFRADKAKDKTSNYRWNPSYQSYRLKITDDGQVISYVGGYYYAPTDTILETNITRGEDPILTISVNKINEEYFDKLKEQKKKYYYFYRSETIEELKGETIPSAELYLSYSISYWNTAKGTQDRKEMENKKITITNGSVTIDNLIPDTIPIDLTKYCYISGKAMIKDENGYYIESYFGWSNHKPVRGSASQSPKGYYLYSEDLMKDEDNEEEYSFSSFYSSYSDSFSFKMGNGQSTDFTFMKQQEEVPNEGKIFYTYIQNEVIDYGITTENMLPFTQKIEYAQSLSIVAAYFDGKQTYPITMNRILFDEDSVELTIDIQADAEEYRPGDTVKLDITVTDPEGNPKSANGAVGVVDEAMFALKEQYIDVVDHLYGDMYFYQYDIKRYTTTTGDVKKENAMDGGKGEEDVLFSDTHRKNFKDTAYFNSFKTDASGKAHLEFVLPDNTTSWRVTAVSITDNLYGGQTKENFIATLPFFVQPISNEVYLVGDEISMRVQGHGTILNKETEIEYTVQILGDGVDMVKMLDNYAYKSNEVSFGKLEAGDYTLISTAQIDGYRDTVEKTFTVRKNNLDLTVSRKIDPTEIDTIEASRYPVTLVFYNEESEPYISSLNSLFTHYCGRLDQMMSRYTAKMAMLEMSDDTKMPLHIKNTRLDIADRQNEDGGIGWYIGDKSDLTLTAKMALLAPERFDKGLMALYLREEISKTNQSKEGIAIAYLGLASLGEDVSAEIKSQLEEVSPETIEEIYYITALSYTTEFEEGLKLYNEKIAVHLKGDAKGKKYVSSASVNVSDSQKTSAAWMAASRYSVSDANDISTWCNSSKWGLGNIFETMFYVKECVQEFSPKQITYSVDGQEETISLGVKGRASRMFTKSEFEGFTLVETSDGVQVMAYYTGEPEEAGQEQSDLFSVDKKIEAISENEYIVTVALTFEPNAPLGEYTINEWIPSNMRMTERPKKPEYYVGYYFSSSQEDQNVYITFNRWGSSENKVSFTYKMKRTYEAAAVVDRTYMLHLETGEIYATDRYEFNAESVTPYEEPVSSESFSNGTSSNSSASSKNSSSSNSSSTSSKSFGNSNTATSSVSSLESSSSSSSKTTTSAASSSSKSSTSSNTSASAS